MTGAMYAAIGGLKTHMTNLNVIGNNIANVNTTGYKAQRMIFQESIYTMSKAGSDGTVTRGGNTPSQIGYGAQVGSIDLMMSPGTFNPTGYGLDCMIEGDGFFLVGDKTLTFDSTADLTKLTLTRAGDLNIDANGWVTDGNNNVVYGFAMVQNPYYQKNATTIYDENGNNIIDEYILSTELVPLRVPVAAAVPTKGNGGLNDDGTTNWDAGEAVYDLFGAAETVEGSARRNFSLYESMYENPNTNITVNEDGSWVLPSGVGTKTGVADANATADPYKGPLPDETGARVQLESISINTNGAITGVNSKTGKTVVVGYIAVGQCAAPDGVTHTGGPYYKAMEGAGEMSVGIAGGLLGSDTYLNNQKVVTGTDTGNTGNATGGYTPGIKDLLNTMSNNQIRPNGLEASTADVATEFANMIVTQRGYQANTRIVTVTDSMLEELVNMKR